MIKKLDRTLRVARYMVYKETEFNLIDFCWSFLGAFAGISCISFINHLIFSNTDFLFLIGSFGASAVLVYAVPESPLSQPRNVIAGHILSAIVGVCVQMVYYQTPWLAGALAVSLSIVAMQATKTVHPPGGATALIATIGGMEIKSLGFLYVMFPVAIGAFILVISSIIINRLSGYRKYPS